MLLNKTAKFYYPTSKNLLQGLGHGALIHNLNQIKNEYVFIKNIDNVQHFEKRHLALKTWKILTGFLMEFKDAKKVIKAPSLNSLIKLNEKYQFFFY